MQTASIIGTHDVASMKTKHHTLAWTVTLTASLFFFYVFIQINLFNTIDESLMQFFNLNALELGKLSSMFFYANALFLFPAGVLLDRFSTKKILIIATLLTTLGTWIFGLARTYEVAAVARFLVGAGSAFCFLSCIRIATRWFPPTQMAFVTGVIVTMAMIGGLVAQTPMAILCHKIGWQPTVLIDAGLGIFILVAIIFFVKDYPPNSEASIKAQQKTLQSLGFWQSILKVLLYPQNWFCGLYTALLNLPVFLLGALWGIHYLMQAHHLTWIEASYATTLLFVGIIIGSPFFGWLSDAIGRRVLPMIIGAIISLGAMLVLIYVPDLSLMSILFLFFFIGFITSSQVLTYPLAAELNSIALTSTAISVISVTIMLSGVIFQPLFGWIMQSHWDQSITNGVPLYSSSDLVNAMLIMPIAFAIGLLIAFFMKETFCRSVE